MVATPGSVWPQMATTRYCSLALASEFSADLLAISTANHSDCRVRVTLRLADYCQSVRIGAKPLEGHD
jgi:hypothetical protein